MSHFTCMVVLPREPEDRGDLEEILNKTFAPFDENTQVDPYRDYSDPIPKDWRERGPKYKSACAQRNALRDISQDLRDDGFDEQWTAACDLVDESHIPWPYSHFMDDAGNFSIDLDDPKFVAMKLSQEWSEPYEVDEVGMYQMSTYNPQSQWDWWVIGGRWTGYFQVSDPANERTEHLGPEARRKLGWDERPKYFLGESGTFGNSPPTAHGTWPADVVRKGDINEESMLLAKARQAGEWYDEAFEKYPDDERAREFMSSINPGESREDYIVRMVGTIESLLKPYAVLAEGVWRDGGKMGWWGVDHGTKDSKQSYAEWFDDFWSKMPDDTWVAVCDLHI